jgi:hypothetical protein
MEVVELREGTHVTRNVILRPRTRSRSGSKVSIRQLLDLTANSSTRAQTNLHITGYSQTFDLTQTPFRKLRQPQQYLNMATRLVLVLGDLFIPDRAIVSPSTSTLHTTMKQPG